jgi:uncharacterized protein (DUF433 family)
MSAWAGPLLLGAFLAEEERWGKHGRVAPPAKALKAVMDYRDIITIDPGKRGGRATVRHMRIAVADVLQWLGSGMTQDEIRADYPELTEEDIHACLSYAADRCSGHD